MTLSTSSSSPQTASAADRVISYMEQYRKQWPFSGTALVARKGEILLKEAYGFANREHEVAQRIDTKFRIWSISKSFTAMAIMMLSESQLLRLDDPASRYIDALRRFEPMTIRDLMHHTSGLANYTGLPHYNGLLNRTRMSRQDWLDLIAGTEPLSSPGDVFSYNNSGYYLLGIIVEKVSGLPFEQFIEERILQPLGMNQTGQDMSDRLIPGLASSYSSSDEELIPSEYIHMSSVIGAGGMYSTVEDLYRWEQSFYSGQLLNSETMNALLNAVDAPYGMGWFLGSRNGRRAIFHGGAYRGFRSELHRYPDEELTVILLTNYDFVPVTKITDALAAAALGESPAVPVMPVEYPMPHEQYSVLKGVYEGYGSRAVVSGVGKDRHFLWNDHAAHPFYPISPTRFHHKWHDWEYEFKTGSDGSPAFLGMSKIE